VSPPRLITAGRAGIKANRRLSFRELETFPRAGLAGFFSLFHPWVSPEQTVSLQRAAQISIHLKEGARNREPHGAGLSARATTARVNGEVVGIDELRRLKRLQHHVLQWPGREVVVKAAPIDVDLARTRHHADTRDRRLTATGSNKFLDLRHKISG